MLIYIVMEAAEAAGTPGTIILLGKFQHKCLT